MSKVHERLQPTDRSGSWWLVWPSGEVFDGPFANGSSARARRVRAIEEEHSDEL